MFFYLDQINLATVILILTCKSSSGGRFRISI